MKVFDKFIEELLIIEGGYVFDPSDSGGETNYGVTKRVARKYGYNGEMRDLPLSMAKQIYKEKYWNKLELDNIEKLSPAIAVKLADIAVNMGVKRAAIFAQRLLNVLNDREKHYNDLIVDGLIGFKTINTLHKYLNLRGGIGETVFIRGLNCLQGSFYINLAEKREKDERFIFGWLKNRIN